MAWPARVGGGVVVVPTLTVKLTSGCGTKGGAEHHLPPDGKSPALTADLERMTIGDPVADKVWPMRCASARDKVRGPGTKRSPRPTPASGAGTAHAERAHGDGQPVADSEGSDAGGGGGSPSQFESRFKELKLTTSVTVPDAKTTNVSTQMQKESSRFHPCAVQSLPYSDLWGSPFGRESAVVTSDGDVVHAVQIQLSNVSPLATSIVVTVVASLFTDPLLGGENWATQIEHLCSVKGDPPATTSASAETEFYFVARVSATLNIHRPPHVFCSTSNVGSTRFISVEVQNHTEYPIVLDDLEVSGWCAVGGTAGSRLFSSFFF